MLCLCVDHKKDLINELKCQGLESFISENVEEMQNRIDDLRDNNGEMSEKNFDPLINANYDIFLAFIEDAGTAALSFDGCPLCEISKQSDDLPENWIKGAVSDQFGLAQNIGLIKVN